jgi:hypothetical protein
MHCEASPPHGSARLFALRKPQRTLRRVGNIYYMDKNITSRIANFPHLSKTEPANFWQKLYRRPAPPGIRREVLIPFLAYWIQEIAYGGLKPPIRAELREIAHSLKKDPASSELLLRWQIKRGIRLLRERRGTTREVFVTSPR